MNVEIASERAKRNVGKENLWLKTHGKGNNRMCNNNNNKNIHFFRSIRNQIKEMVMIKKKTKRLMNKENHGIKSDRMQESYEIK